MDAKRGREMISSKAARQEILRLLSDTGEMYGLDMVKASEHLKRGSIYVHLNRMEDEGLVSSRVVTTEGPLAGRRIYSITNNGRAVK